MDTVVLVVVSAFAVIGITEIAFYVRSRVFSVHHSFRAFGVLEFTENEENPEYAIRTALYRLEGIPGEYTPGYTLLIIDRGMNELSKQVCCSIMRKNPNVVLLCEKDVTFYIDRKIISGEV